MAGLFFTAKTAAISVASATTKTLVQVIAASNHRTLLHQLNLSFNGVTAADPAMLAELLLQTTAGTMSALTLAKLCDADDETLQTTAQHTATAEPTASTIKWGDYIHPQTGIIIPFKVPIPIIGGTRLGLRVVPGTMTGLSAVATLLLEE